MFVYMAPKTFRMVIFYKIRNWGAEMIDDLPMGTVPYVLLFV